MLLKQIPRKFFMISCFALLGGATALAQAHPSEPASPSTPANPNANSGMNADTQLQQQNAIAGNMEDRDFVRSALEGGMAEVQLGQIAAQKGSSNDVKQFGQKMVQDHTQLGNQMKQVAQQLNVKVPTALSKKDKETVAKMQTLSGAQFDDAYIRAMVKAHKKDLGDFQHVAETTQNPALKQVAQQGAQMIDQHLQMIDQIAKAHNVTEKK